MQCCTPVPQIHMTFFSSKYHFFTRFPYKIPIHLHLYAVMCLIVIHSYLLLGFSLYFPSQFGYITVLTSVFTIQLMSNLYQIFRCNYLTHFLFTCYDLIFVWKLIFIFNTATICNHRMHCKQKGMGLLILLKMLQVDLVTLSSTCCWQLHTLVATRPLTN